MGDDRCGAFPGASRPAGELTWAGDADIGTTGDAAIGTTGDAAIGTTPALGTEPERVGSRAMN